MNFIWITNNYRVNLESIYSLEKKITDNSENCLDWENKYNQLLNYYKTELPTLEYEGIEYHINNQSSEDDIKKYAEAISLSIIQSIGESPKRFIEEYWIIVSTGVKIQIAKDKYEEINKTIDEIQKNRKN